MLNELECLHFLKKMCVIAAAGQAKLEQESHQELFVTHI